MSNDAWKRTKIMLPPPENEEHTINVLVSDGKNVFYAAYYYDEGGFYCPEYLSPGDRSVPIEETFWREIELP